MRTEAAVLNGRIDACHAKEGIMGKVIRFPIERRLAAVRADSRPREGSATICILPVVRIERHAEAEAPKLGVRSGLRHRAD